MEQNEIEVTPVNSKKGKVIKVVVIMLVVLLIAVGAYFIYKKRQANWVKNYNQEQWNAYVESFNVVKEVATPYISCKDTLVIQRDKLQSAYEASLTADEGALGDKQIFDSNMFSFLRKVTDRLNNSLNYYSQEDPEIQSGIFILDSFSGKPIKINKKTINDRLPKTKEALDWYKYQLETYEVNKITSLYCPADVVSSPTFFNYPLSKESCVELMKIENGFEDKPIQEEDELDVEYQLRLDRYNDELAGNLDRCNEPDMLTKFSY